MRVFAIVATAALVAAIAGCGPSQPADQSTPTVVASTDVWGSIAGAVARDHATVKSIVNSGDADPHSYEASPADAAAIADASLVVYNGGGYDHWVDEVLASHPDVATVNAYKLLVNPLQPANEHVFYDLATAKAVAAQIAENLAQIDGANADAYRANATNFGAETDTISAAERAIGAAHRNTSVVSTEPVAHYLLVDIGIADKTPPGFTSAIEGDTAPSPADLAAMLDLINGRQVSALLYNPQTETAVTKQIEDAARQTAVPVVTVTETLPPGSDYLTWQRQTVDQLASQLDKVPQANR